MSGGEFFCKSTFEFDDNGICFEQVVSGLNGCTTGIFTDPYHSYFYYNSNGPNFHVYQSEGPNNGLAEDGTQHYAIFDLYDNTKDHELISPSCYWTKYSISVGSGNKVYFDLKSIRIKSATVALYFHTDDGWFRVAPNLQPGKWH